MTPTIEQLDEVEIAGEIVAELRLDPCALPLSWEAGADELDTFRRAAVRVPGGPPAVLLAYDHDPAATVLVVMATSDRLETDLDAILEALQVPARAALARASEQRPTAEADPDSLAALFDKIERQQAQITTLASLVQAFVPAEMLAAQGFPTRFDESQMRREIGEPATLDDVADIISLDLHRARRLDAAAEG